MGKGDTIAAIATGMTDSGIGIIRISGSDAVSVGDKVFRSPSGRRILNTAESHKMYYGYIVKPEDDFVIDEAMAVVMRHPRSFTGEDTVEIQCHGGVFVMQKILENVLKWGARLAEPGEFTKRAFLNGRMDLSRAEAVMDVIQSQTEHALASSVNQLKGALWKEVKRLRDEILYEVAFIESAIDDPEHFDLEGYPEKLSIKVEETAACIKKLADTAQSGRLRKEGIRTVIVGKPNAGKSSFLNRLLGEERAIVTQIPGTTRDTLEDSLRLGDIILNIVDTAGIRDTEDAVEKIGVEKARKYAREADLIVYVVDASVGLDENDREIMSFIGDKRVIVLLNKSDLVNVVTEDGIRELFRETASQNGSYFEIIRTSALEGEGMDSFERTVKDMFFSGEIKSNHEIVITNIRHKEALDDALEALGLVEKSIGNGMPEDFYSIDLMNAYASLGRIIGEEVDDDLVEEIFSKFCMGK